MDWPVGTYCRVEQHPGKAFQVASRPHQPPTCLGDLPLMYRVRAVDGETGDFYAYADELGTLSVDEFCECGTIGCTEDTA